MENTLLLDPLILLWGYGAAFHMKPIQWEDKPWDSRNCNWHPPAGDENPGADT